jgi:hypothetical protein
MVGYILRADVEMVLDVIREHVDSHVFRDLTYDVTDYRRWIELSRSAEWERAKTLVERLGRFKHKVDDESNDEPYTRLSAIIEHMRMLEGAVPPHRFGNNYDTVTAFGELQGDMVIGAQKDGRAFIEYKGHAKELGEGKIDEIWECPEGNLVTIFDGQLWRAGRQLTEEGEKAHSLRGTYFGCNRPNPFNLDGKFTFIKERQKPGNKILSDVWLVHGDETIPLGEKWYMCTTAGSYLYPRSFIEEQDGKVGVENADGEFRVLTENEPMRPDTESVLSPGNMSNRIIERSPRGGCTNPDVASYPQFYINDWMLRRVENVCYVAGRPAYRLMYATKKELKERLPSGGIRLHDDSVTYDTARYVAVWHQGNSIAIYSDSVKQGLKSWADENLGGMDAGQVYQAIADTPVHSSKKLPNVRGFVKLLGKFSKEYLGKEQARELEGMVKG